MMAEADSYVAKCVADLPANWDMAKYLSAVVFLYGQGLCIIAGKNEWADHEKLFQFVTGLDISEIDRQLGEE